MGVRWKFYYQRLQKVTQIRKRFDQNLEKLEIKQRQDFKKRIITWKESIQNDPIGNATEVS